MKLFEMPLAGIEHHGDWTNDEHSDVAIDADESSFSDFTGKNSFLSRIDRRLATNPRLLERLTTAFQRHDTKFYLYMMNHPEMSYFLNNLDYGRMDNNRSYSNNDSRDPSTVTSLFGEELVKVLEKRRKERSVQLILTHNEGGVTRHPLTPWIITHRMVHGLLGTDPDRMAGINLMKSMFHDVLSDHYEFQGNSVNPEPRRKIIEHAGMKLMKAVCTFKAAREDNILNNDPLELYVELWTQYLMTGKLGRNPAPEILPSYKLKSQGQADKAVNEVFDFVVEKIESTLEESQGHVFIC